MNLEKQQGTCPAEEQGRSRLASSGNAGLRRRRCGRAAGLLAWLWSGSEHLEARRRASGVVTEVR